MERNTWKIGDFGFTVHGTSKNLISTDLAKGTKSYRAPELLQEQSKYNNKVDIWAMGCIFYELVTQQTAFRDDYETREWSFSNQEKMIPLDIVLDETSKNVISQLINQCLNPEPKERPTTKSICRLLQCYPGLSVSDISLNPSDPRKVEPKSGEDSIPQNGPQLNTGI